jgi:hypothetical protein
MTDIKAEALDWLRSYRNFPQLQSVNKAGFPIGRTTWFPIEDDWSIHATGYRGNYRVKQIRNNPHLEAMWLDTTETPTRSVRIRGLGYHTVDESLVRIYNEREDIARAGGGGFGPRLFDKEITDTVCCTHITPLRVRLEGFGQQDSPLVWDVSPDDLLPEPPLENGNEAQSGPTGFRQELDMSIDQASVAALEWCGRQPARQHLYVIEDGFPTGDFAMLYAGDDWTTLAVLEEGTRVVDAVLTDAHAELAWIDIAHDWPKMTVPKAVFVQGQATVLEPDAAREALNAVSWGGSENVQVIRVHPTRIRTEGFGEGLQLYAWNV